MQIIHLAQSRYLMYDIHYVWLHHNPERHCFEFESVMTTWLTTRMVNLMCDRYVDHTFSSALLTR